MDNVLEFENQLAEYFSSPYCVTVDCVTHAIELCLRQKKITQTTCPKHTYLSIPMTLEKIGLDWKFTDDKWQDLYKFGGTNIYDAAVFWTPGGYVPGTMMCLSFQFKKTLSLGRGGAILLDNEEDAVELKRMSHDYRNNKGSWVGQIDQITKIGYHYYMTPETAQQGIEKLNTVQKNKECNWQNYPDISKAPLFNE